MRFQGCTEEGAWYSYDTEWDVEDGMFKAQIAANESTVNLLKKFNEYKTDYFYVRESVKLFFEGADTIYQLNFLLNRRRLQKELNPMHSQMSMTDFRNIFTSQMNHRQVSGPLSMYVAIEYIDDYINFDMYSVPRITLPSYVFLREICNDFLMRYPDYISEKPVLLERQISFNAQPAKERIFNTNATDSYYIDGYVVTQYKKEYRDERYIDNLMHNIQASGLQKKTILK